MAGKKSGKEKENVPPKQKQAPTTPSKSNALSSYTPQTPGGVTNPSTFTGPSSKGKGEDISGFLVAVGPTETSKKGNKYFMLSVQVSKTEILSITVMEKERSPPRTTFTPHCSNSITFKNIYRGDGSYFYFHNTSWETCEIFSFTLEDLTTSLGTIKQRSTGPIIIIAKRWFRESI